MPKKKSDEQGTTQVVSGDPYDQVSKTLRDITDAVTKVYMGLTQRDAIETLICGLLTKGTVLLYGSHGNYKTSMSKFFGNLFTKPVYKLAFSVENTEQLKSRLHALATELNVDENMFARNLLAGIDVQYAQYGGKIDVTVDINALQYTMKSEQAIRVPLNNYVRQVNSFSEQEDVVGYGIDNPLLLKDVPPHMVKRSYMANADFIVLDEVFKNPRLISILHNILNDKEYDSIVGAGRVEPEAFVLLTNPLNDNYQTNVAMVDFASIAADEPITLRRNGKISVVRIGEFIDEFFQHDEIGEKKASGWQVLAFDDKTLRPKFSRFKSVARHRANQLLSIHHEGGTIKVTPNHSVFTMREGGLIDLVKADKLKAGDYLVTFNGAGFRRLSPSLSLRNKPLRWNANIIPKAINLTEDIAWLLGLFIADGDTTTEGTIRIALNNNNKKDKAVEQRLRNVVPSLFGLTCSTRDEGNCRIVSFTSNKLANWFNHTCRRDDGTRAVWSKQVPKFILTAPLNVVKAFYQGLCDGDGWTAKPRGGQYHVWDTVNRQLSDEVSVLLRLNNIASNRIIEEVKARVINGKVVKATTVFRLYVSDYELNGREGCTLSNAPSGKRLPLGPHSSLMFGGKATSQQYLMSVKPFIEKVQRLTTLAEHGVGVFRIDSIEQTDGSCFVYDICGADFQSFFAGASPVLCHNSLDRYMFSAYVSPPTSQEILIMQDQFTRAKPSTLPIETIYAARELYNQVRVPAAIQVFVMGLLSAMSKCYFTLEGKRHVDGKDVFAVEHSCDVCQYGGAAGDKNWSICSKANVGKVRASIAVMNSIKAHAFVAGRKEANSDDLFFALRHSLPHRIKWNADFKEDTIASTDKVISRYVELVSNFADQLDKVEDIVKDPTPAAFATLRKANKDVPAVLAFIDEFTDRFKEVAIAKGDKQSMEALDPGVNLAGALKIFGLDSDKKATTKDAAPPKP